ncbi:MAG: 50S ribosomal protein L4 [Cardiobacteriaceae bacterium]|nr:50S ribosomal protein L4 [Cardiobacteriaceae bacterium]MBR1374994.1 50S ribosomal protein L4 [Cardiobacteriaceae bacterium]
MDIQFKNASGSVAVEDSVFAAEFNESLVHQIVVSYLAGGRSGTKAQKTRSEVSGGGVKPWKQKGTGRARAGTIRSPLWRTGGITFAAKPRDYSQKVNRKMYRGALRAIFSELNRQNRLVALNSLALAEAKTKKYLEFAAQNQLNESVLFIAGEVDTNFYLASRNVPKVTVIDVESINPVVLLRHEQVVVDEAALKKISEWLSI